MKKFLEEVAGLFAGRADLPDMCFVFPNRRSSLFFQRYLGRSAGRPVFSPRLLTINELFAELSDLRQIDKIELLALLHKCYVSVNPPAEGEAPEPFDKFICWGDILLGDFDDIDKYLVQTDKLLKNLGELRDLSVSYDFLSDSQKEAIAEFCRNFNPDVIHGGRDDKKRMFVDTWDVLLPLYNEFRSALLSGGTAYEGMIYRSVAENVDVSSLKEKYSEVVFVGLNALNECEKVLLKAIRDEGFGDFYWDFYGDMVTDPDNRAGDFIRGNVAEFPSRHRLESVMRDFDQHFEVISVPSSVGQTRVASRILSDLQQNGQIGDSLDTAVVLPDESLLFPMLNAIPETVGKVNVTMGYPLSASAVSDFFGIIERLQNNARQRGGKVQFYHRDVTDMLEHQYFVRADGDGLCSGIKKGIVGKNRIFVDCDEFMDCPDLFTKVFRYVESPARMTEYITGVIYALQAAQTATDREFLYSYLKAAMALGSLDLDFATMERRTFFKLLGQYVALISIPYRGEPLSGLQVMGPLETRALDFRNVIMLSVGEGVFPSKNVSASFIPYNLRKGFGMPTYEFQDAIWAYHFYRSIYRAKNIYLMYDSRTEGLRSGEESRYIKQLKYHYGTVMDERVATYSLSSAAGNAVDVRVEKDEKVMKELEDRFIHGTAVFSASSLNVYIDCPLQFYFKFVKGFEEQKEVMEELDAGLFGTVFHKTMQSLYGPFVGGTVTGDDLKAILENVPLIEQTVNDSFHNDARIDEIEGRNLILRNLIVKYVLRTVGIDKGMTPFRLVGVEQKATLEHLMPSGNKVRLFGYIDRMDSNCDGIVRVVDYKTGNVNKKDDCRDVARMFEDPQDRRPNVAFQLYFYSLLLTYGAKGDTSVQYDQCIYSLRSIFKNLPESHSIRRDMLDEYRDRVYALINEIFDASVPFEGRSANGKVCEYCEFKRLCGK